MTRLIFCLALVAGCGSPTCTCIEICKPVCGSDGKSYGNACVAKCADVEVAHEGACSAGDPGC